MPISPLVLIGKCKQWQFWIVDWSSCMYHYHCCQTTWMTCPGYMARHEVLLLLSSLLTHVNRVPFYPCRKCSAAALQSQDGFCKEVLLAYFNGMQYWNLCLRCILTVFLQRYHGNWATTFNYRQIWFFRKMLYILLTELMKQHIH